MISIENIHNREIIAAGKKLSEAEKVLILLHGRGATADDILSLTDYLDVKSYALLAPQATNDTWYPYSFLSPPSQNEPWLSSALLLIENVVSNTEGQGTAKSNIYFLGFSQGACLTLEFVTRHPARYGGVVAFTGGLIGDKLYTENYLGDFEGTPVFIGTSDPDPHIPVDRVHASATQMQKMNASVTTRVYQNMGHTINEEEIEWANKIVFSPLGNENR